MSTDFYKISIEPYTNIISKICRSYTDTNEDFEDFFQETCLQIWKSRQNFKGNSEWSTWVYRITLNVCLTLIKKKRISKTPFFDNDFQLIDESQINSLENKEEISRLFQAIKKLQKLDRAFILLYLEEKSYKEIAEILGTTTNNVGSKINRIKTKLKSIYYGN